MRSAIIILVIALLFLLAITSSSAQELGCCCNPDGEAQKATLQPDNECDGTAGFTFQKPADEDIIGKDFATLCEDFCGKGGTGGVPELQVGCGSPDFVPSVENLQATPVRGESKIRLSWDQQCSDFVNSISIKRCEGEECSPNQEIARMAFANSFVDKQGLEFGSTYTYEITTELTYDTSEPVVVSRYTGDIECRGVTDNRAFCSSETFYRNFLDYFTQFGYQQSSPSQFGENSFGQTVTDLFGFNFNKALQCDDVNRIFTVKDCNLETASDGSPSFCIVAGGTPSCSQSTNCKALSPDPFGLVSDPANCEGSSGDRNFCFLDRSKSLADECFNCLQGMSCYDYRTKRSCGADNCGAGQCEWVDVFPEIGIGVCIDQRFSNCKLCDQKGTPGAPNFEAYNEVFDQCTIKKAEALSTPLDSCFFFFDDATGIGSAAGCGEVDCTAFTPAQCGSPAQGIQLDADNNVVSKSNDPCGIGVCQIAGPSCAKNADGDSEGDFRDCAEFSGNAQSTCEKDYFPPETEFLSLKSPKGVLERIEIIRKDKETATEIPDSIRGDQNPTFFCVGGGCTDFTPMEKNELLVFNTILQIIEDNEAKVFAVLQDGENTIRYFTQDKHKNKEVVKSFTFNACATCSGPQVINVSVSNSVEHEGVYHSRDSNPRIEVFFNTDTINIQNNEIVRGQLRTSAQVQTQGNKASFIPSGLTDGEYTLIFQADSQGAAMEEPAELTFVVDTIPPIVTVTVDDNATPGAIIFQNSAPIALEFSEAVGLDEALITSKNFSKFVIHDVITNVTDDFSAGSQDTRYTLSFKGPEGENVISIKATDLAGHTVEATHNFRIFTEAPKIRLTSPTFGVAPDFTFDISAETNNPADCRFWFNTDDPPIPPFEDLNLLEEFDLTGFTTHVKRGINRITQELEKYDLTIRCQDSFGRESSALYKLSVDTTPPTIINAFATPDPVIQKPFKTTLKISTDDETFCKASKTSTTYGAMELRFPGFEVEGATVHELEVEEPSIGTYEYKVACINLAELGPSKENISFEVMEGIPFTITSNTPRYTQNTTIPIALETNKDATCFLSKDQNQAGDKIGTGNVSRIHFMTIVEEQEGSFTYFATCVTGGATVIGGEPERATLKIEVTVDSIPPTMDFVNDDSPLFADKEISYFKTHIRAKWKGTDEQSGVGKYMYTVEDQASSQIAVQETPSDKEDYFVDIFFDVQDGTKYQVNAYAVDKVGLTSPSMSSDGVLIDFSREPAHCVNGIFEPDLGEVDLDCSGECYKCKEGQTCNSNQDCATDFCEAKVCQAPKCDDGIRNGRESDIDCGGDCGDCDNGKHCLLDRDCSSRYCSTALVCEKAPICFNHRLDGTETDVDCGGACPTRCGTGKHCKSTEDCEQGKECIQEVESGIGKCYGEGEIPEEIIKEQEKDSDGDGLPDWYEEKYGIDDPDADDDGDGLTNLEEYLYFKRTGREISPSLWDSDGDGWSDFDEIRWGFNPLDSNSYPESKWWKIVAIIIAIVGFGLIGYYAYDQYGEYQKQQAKPKEEVKARRKETPEKSHKEKISERAKRVHELLGKKEDSSYLTLGDISKEKEKQLKDKEKRTKSIFSDLSSVGKGKRPVRRPSSRKSALEGLKKISKPRPSSRKDRAFEKLATLGSKSLSPAEKRRIAQKLKKLGSEEATQQERKKILKDLRMTADYYKKNKEDLAKQAEKWYKSKTSVKSSNKKKGKKSKKRSKTKK